MIFHVDPPQSITWIHQDISCGSTRIHNMDPPGFTCGSTKIHHVDPLGSIMWFHQDPSCGATRIHHVDPLESIMWIHQDPSSGYTNTPGTITEWKEKQERSSYCYLKLFHSFFPILRVLKELALLKKSQRIL